MKINVKLENCYGIQSLEKEFDFSNKNVFSIYASNGTMKTSFAKTFVDLSEKNASKDEIYPDKKTIRDIKKDNTDLHPEEIFVIKPYDQEYKSDNISVLLINDKLKKEYDQKYSEIQRQKDDFLKKIENLSGLSPKKIEDEVCNIFHQGENDKFFESLDSIGKEILNESKPLFRDIRYDSIFNEKTKDIIKDKVFLSKIMDYVEQYNSLLKNSFFFKKGVFNHTQAADIANQLEKNGFFGAGHSVMLKGEDEQIKTKVDLEKIIENEKSKILKDENLKKKFDDLDKKLKKNQDLKEFREYLSENHQIIAELKNPFSLKAKIFKSYFKEDKESFKSLLDNFEKSKEEVKKIEAQAKKEEGNWYKVINEFNDKFFVPFSLHVDNQVDVILKRELPHIGFKFDEENVPEDKLLKVLSQGEKRALYILNILFEIEVRKKTESNCCLLVIDDIADSFDYKNKYTIIEYLNEISKISRFYLIILTHNFDFHRSICSRLDMGRKNKLNAIKFDNNTMLEEEVYQDNPLNHWKDNLDKNIYLLASIPMVRNLFQYSGKDKDFDLMTKFLHIKQDTKKLTINNLKECYKNLLDNELVQKINKSNNNFYEYLCNECEAICDSNDDSASVRLESKIVLSIGIRLKAEEFMIEQINDNDFINNIKGNQTFKLFEKYREKFNSKKECIKTLEKVNLMTPENIHLNSFMYEPILDMSSDELKKLYKAVSDLT